MKNYPHEHIDELDELSAEEQFEQWNRPHPNLEFSLVLNTVRYFSTEIRVKDETILALEKLSYSLRHQQSSKAPPSKEDLYSACGYNDREENGKKLRKYGEFKINKDLFFYPELKGLVKFCRRRKGYYLDLD